MVNKIEISHKTILFVFLLLIGFWLIYQIKDILLVLFIAFILMSALSSPVDRLERLKIPRVLAILLIYIVIFLILGLVGTLVFPPLISQSGRLLARLPEFINSIFPNARIDIQTIIQQVVPVGGGVVKLSVGIFTNFITIITLLVFTFYFLLERKKLENDLVKFMGEEAGRKVFSIITEIETKLGAWVRGEMALMTIIGFFTFVGLTVLKIDYALPLAIFAGFLEIIPIVGPIISAVPAVLVGLSVSPLLALIVAALYTLIQQLENNLFVPTVMRRAVGISPLVTILSLMIGGRLGGALGALLSIPLLIVLRILFGHYLKSK